MGALVRVFVGREAQFRRFGYSYDLSLRICKERLALAPLWAGGSVPDCWEVFLGGMQHCIASIHGLKTETECACDVLRMRTEFLLTWNYS